MKKLPILLFMLILCSWSAYARQADVVSPDKRLRFRISCGDSLEYRVEYKGKPLIGRSCIGLDISQLPQGAPVVLSTSRRSVNGTIRPLYGKTERLSDRYNELRIDFAGGWALLVRAYDEGVAYRFVTELPGRIVVRGESANFNIPDDPGVLFPETAALTAWELAYVDYQNLSAVEERTQAITPVLLSRKDGVRTVIAEADVRDYPGMYLVKTGRGLHSAFAAYPDSVAMGSWGNFVSVVRSRKEHIAETSGRREFPWRVIMATDDDRTLLTNELIYKLASPQAPGDFSWVRPGKAAWEWWHDAMLPGASVPSGMNNRNTALYKHYIDFAAENNLEYLMIDAGWSDIFNLSKVNPQVDIKELMRYAKQKDVGVFLWCVAHTLVSDPDRYMRLLSEWGVAGLKVDFFDRDDQIAMQWYEELARKAAEYKLLLNYHGCSKPTGMQRLYPNIVNFEAVRGAECSKWDLTANPEHHLTFPFTRMLGGSVDYTPGALRNRSRQTFKPVDPGLPMAQGTRCHELAMFVVFDQYLAMLCDLPAEYRKYPDLLGFLAAVPVVFDQTEVLSARVGDYAVMAKRRGDEWFVGGMTDWTARSSEIDFSFLRPGVTYAAEIFRDGTDANLYADRYECERRTITSTDKLTLRMAAGGGFAIRLTPQH